MPRIVAQTLCASVLLFASACSSQEAGSPAGENLTLRNLTESSVKAPLRESYPIEGDLIPTPSDTRTRYYLLRDRQPLMNDNLIALIREESADKAAYARIELNCAKRLFHIVGVANRRSFAETSMTSDGALRPIEGYPLRAEIAAFVCERNGTPLAKAS